MEKYTPIIPPIIITHNTNNTYFLLKSMILESKLPVTVPKEIISSPRTKSYASPQYNLNSLAIVSGELGSTLIILLFLHTF